MGHEPIGWGQLLPLIVFMVVMIVMFYYVVIMPTKKRQKAHQNLVSTIREGDQVITAGGLYGKIVKVRDRTVDLEVAPGVRLRFDRRAIRRQAEDSE